MANRDTHLRSLLKGLTWRMLATFTTVVIAWIVVGDVTVALEIGAIEVVAKVAIYYLHERVWEWIPRSNSGVSNDGEVTVAR